MNRKKIAQVFKERFEGYTEKYESLGYRLDFVLRSQSAEGKRFHCVVVEIYPSGMSRSEALKSESLVAKGYLAELTRGKDGIKEGVFKKVSSYLERTADKILKLNGKKQSLKKSFWSKVAFSFLMPTVFMGYYSEKYVLSEMAASILLGIVLSVFRVKSHWDYRYQTGFYDEPFLLSEAIVIVVICLAVVVAVLTYIYRKHFKE